MCFQNYHRHTSTQTWRTSGRQRRRDIPVAQHLDSVINVAAFEVVESTAKAVPSRSEGLKRPCKYLIEAMHKSSKTLPTFTFHIPIIKLLVLDLRRPSILGWREIKQNFRGESVQKLFLALIAAIPVLKMAPESIAPKS